MADAKVFKFNVGSSTDKLVQEIVHKFDVDTDADAIQNSLALTQMIGSLASGTDGKVKTITIVGADGKNHVIQLP